MEQALGNIIPADFGRDDVEERKRAYREEIDALKKKVFARVQETWNTRKGGKLNEAMFYSSTSYMVDPKEWREALALYDWCVKMKFPFGAIFRTKYFIHYYAAKKRKV